MGSKRFKNLICAYCATRTSVTGDHVFAREFFLLEHRQNLPQAPVCDYCNNEKSKVEHYLTALLPFGGRHVHSTKNLTEHVPKRLKKNQQLHKELNQYQSRVNLVENGRSSEAMALPIRPNAIESLFTYIVKGLAWHHWRAYIDDKDCSVEVMVLSDHGRQFFQNNLFSMYSPNRVLGNLGEGTVIYEGVQGIDCPQITIWRFHMYGGMVLAEDSVQASTEIGAMSGPNRIMRNAT